MSILAHGIDMVECERLHDAIERHGERFLNRIFTQAEQDYCLGKKRRIEHLAGRFAAKEAVLKVMGTGWTSGINWTDIEIRNEPSGQPLVRLSGKCRQIAESRGMTGILVSISHVGSHAIASAIGLDEPSPAAKYQLAEG